MAKKAPAKKSPAKKAPVKKGVAKKATATKGVAKKRAAKKAPAKKVKRARSLDAKVKRADELALLALVGKTLTDSRFRAKLLAAPKPAALLKKYGLHPKHELNVLEALSNPNVDRLIGDFLGNFGDPLAFG